MTQTVRVACTSCGKIMSDAERQKHYAINQRQFTTQLSSIAIMIGYISLAVWFNEWVINYLPENIIGGIVYWGVYLSCIIVPIWFYTKRNPKYKCGTYELQSADNNNYASVSKKDDEVQL